MDKPERTNEELLDLFADVLEPVGEILQDKEFVKAADSGQKLTAVSMAIKNHKKAIIKILALVDGVPEDEYKVNLGTLTFKLLKLLNKPEVQLLFFSQAQKSGGVASGSATESTEDGAN